MVDARMLKEGQEFKDLNEPYVIFITEKGYFGCGLPIYTINRQISPFLNVSVLEGSGTLNGQAVKKGDHFVVPAGYGRMQFEGDRELIASTVAG